MEPILAIGLATLAVTAIGAVVAAISVVVAIVYGHRQSRIAAVAFGLQQRTYLAGRSPVSSVGIGTLPEALPNFPALAVRYVERVAGETTRLDNLARTRRLMIIGRTGLGKTREALEVIRRASVREGEEPTVLLVDDLRAVPTDLPAFPTRSVFLLVDDIHLLATRYYSQTQSAVRFEEWIGELISTLDEVAKDRLRIVATLRDEPGIAEKVRLDDPLWASFAMHQLPDLSREQAGAALEAAAEALGMSVEPDARTLLVERNDGTFMSFLAYLRSERQRGTVAVTQQIAARYQGTYPLIWADSYDRFIRRNRAFAAIFASLAVLRSLGVTPTHGMLRELATSRLRPRLFRGLLFDRSLRALGAWVTLETVESDWAWGERSVVLVRCPDAYLDGLSDLAEASVRRTTGRVLAFAGLTLSGRKALTREIHRQVLDAYDGLFPEVAPDLVYWLTRAKFGTDLVSGCLRLAIHRAPEAEGLILYWLRELRSMSRSTTHKQWTLPFGQIMTAEAGDLLDAASELEPEGFSSDPVAEYLGEELLGLRVELACSLGYLRAKRGVDEVIALIDELSPGTSRGDAIGSLAFFRDPDSMEQVISAVDKWRNLPAYGGLEMASIILSSPTLAVGISGDEADEEAAIRSDRREDSMAFEPATRAGVERALVHQSPGMRHRGLLAAFCFEPEFHSRVVGAIVDADPSVAGAALLMLSRHAMLRDIPALHDANRNRYYGEYAFAELIDRCVETARRSAETHASLKALEE